MTKGLGMANESGVFGFSFLALSLEYHFLNNHMRIMELGYVVTTYGKYCSKAREVNEMTSVTLA